MGVHSFACAETQAIFEGKKSKKFSTFRSVLERKLQMLDDATQLNDLASPPNNNLEPLDGRRSGQHSIRVSGKWRICFVWTASGPKSVECVDYHDERRY